MNVTSYVNYTKYTNEYILSLIDKIQASSEEKPIIVIFGDHGVRKKYYISDEKKHMEELLTDKDFLDTHFNTFLAYTNPDEYSYPEVNSLVNFFRVFMNKNFGTDFELLEDKRFYAYYDAPGTLKKIKGFQVR